MEVNVKSDMWVQLRRRHPGTQTHVFIIRGNSVKNDAPPPHVFNAHAKAVLIEMQTNIMFSSRLTSKMARNRCGAKADPVFNRVGIMPPTYVPPRLPNSKVILDKSYNQAVVITEWYPSKCVKRRDVIRSEAL